MYKVTITARAERELRKLDRQSKNRIVVAILALASDPRPPGCLKVQSEEGVWRIRIGDYRAGYTINDATQEVDVIRVGHRKDFYN